jgi:hypothetical protein
MRANPELAFATLAAPVGNPIRSDGRPVSKMYLMPSTICQQKLNKPQSDTGGPGKAGHDTENGTAGGRDSVAW